MMPNLKSILLTVILGVTLVFAGYAALKEAETTTDVTQPVQPSSHSSSETEEVQAPGNANEPRTRGQLLYTNHCQSCHESAVHIRGNRRVKSLADLRYWVGRWAVEIELKWSAEEIDDVANYLNRQFYRF